MEPVRVIEGVVAPLDRVDVDTDQIIPKQFLKRIERTGYGAFLFHDWRYGPDGDPDPDFVLNRAPFARARILVTGQNFGCGSSREHAAWALADFGFGAIIAPGFADIFRSNCFESGIVPVELEEQAVREIVHRATGRPGFQARVDVETGRVRAEDGLEVSFELDPFRRRCLLEGLDTIGLTLARAAEIDAYERRRAALDPACDP